MKCRQDELSKKEYYIVVTRYPNGEYEDQVGSMTSRTFKLRSLGEAKRVARENNSSIYSEMKGRAANPNRYSASYPFINRESVVLPITMLIGTDPVYSMADTVNERR